MGDDLDASRLRFFRENGYLVLPDFVDKAACGRLRQRAREIVADFDPAESITVFTTRDQARVSNDYFLTSGDKIRCFFEEEAVRPDGSIHGDKMHAINKIGHALHDLDPVFDAFSRTPDLAGVAAALGFVQPVLLQSMFIFKQPRFGGEVGGHQDATFLYTEPLRVVGFWFALQQATLENGCLWVLPGGHRRGLTTRFVRDGRGGTKMVPFDVDPWPEDGWVPLPVEEGTMVILDGLLPHRSDANRSPHSRHAYTLHLIEADCQYPADNWLQRACPPRGFQIPEKKS